MSAVEYTPTFEIETEDQDFGDDVHRVDMTYTGEYSKGGAGCRGSYLEFTGLDCGQVLFNPSELLVTKERAHGSGDLRAENFNQLADILNGNGDERIVRSWDEFITQLKENNDQFMPVESYQLPCSEKWKRVTTGAADPAWILVGYDQVYFTTNLKGVLAEVDRARCQGEAAGVTFDWI